MIRIVFLLIGLTCCLDTLQAQSYRTALGLRFSSEKTIGLTVQQKIADQFTLEGILQTGGGNYGQHAVILLAEQHQKIFTKNLNLYYGLGVHKSWYKSVSLEEEWSNPAGLATIVGLELALGRMALSVDAQPSLNIWGGHEFLQFATGFSLRYVLIKPKKKRFNWKFWKKK